MTLQDIINPDSVLCNAQARSKKHCIEILSELLAQSNPEIASEEIFEKLIERERLGCTSLDKGIAFPHCRVNGVEASCGAVIKVSSPVDFDAPDGELVDIVFGLMVPEQIDECHYADVENLAGLLRDEALRSRMRAATSSSELYEALLAGELESEPDLRGTASL